MDIPHTTKTPKSFHLHIPCHTHTTLNHISSTWRDIQVTFPTMIFELAFSKLDLSKAIFFFCKKTIFFFARKPNKAGKRFGFCTISSKDSIDYLLCSLNNFWFDCYKLRVNLARFET